jgi:hypothetical protein
LKKALLPRRTPFLLLVQRELTFNRAGCESGLFDIRLKQLLTVRQQSAPSGLARHPATVEKVEGLWIILWITFRKKALAGS